MIQAKINAAKMALELIGDNRIIGIGTGSTVNCFIEQLAAKKMQIDACVASSNATAERLKAAGIPVIELNDVDEIPLYIDGADEINPAHQMIKGGGGALTREKIIATVAKQFICIVDETKLTKQLGKFPLAVEVIPMARSFVARKLVKMGGNPVYRTGFITDNGNIILDVYHLDFTNPKLLEENINLIPGVVENGLFARRLADKVIVAANHNQVYFL